RHPCAAGRLPGGGGGGRVRRARHGVGRGGAGAAGHVRAGREGAGPAAAVGGGRSRLGAGARPPRRRGARRRHVRGPAQRPLPHLSGTHELPGVRAGSAGGAAVTTFDAGPRYTPDELARLLRLPPPTREQAAVISAPLAPLLVVAGAGSGKTETMAARVVWLVANGYVHP